jgi:hypothetical protein
MILRKTPEQLDAQFSLIDPRPTLDSGGLHKGLIHPSRGSELPSTSDIERFYNESVGPRYSHLSDNYFVHFPDAYAAYVDKLRELRKTQAAQFERLGHAQFTSADTYLSSRMHLPEDSKHILELLNSRFSQELSPADASAGIENPSFVAARVAALATKNPREFSELVGLIDAGDIKALPRLLGKETFLSLMASSYGKDPRVMVFNYPTFVNHFGLEVVRELVPSAITACINELRSLPEVDQSIAGAGKFESAQRDYYLLLKFLDDQTQGDSQQLLGPDQVKRYVDQVIRSIPNLSFLGLSESLKMLGSRGLVSRDLFSELILKEIDENAIEVYSAAQFYSDLLTPGCLETLSRHAETTVLASENPVSLLFQVEHLLPREKVREIIRQGIESGPEEAICIEFIFEYFDLDEIATFFSPPRLIEIARGAIGGASFKELVALYVDRGLISETEFFELVRNSLDVGAGVAFGLLHLELPVETKHKIIAMLHEAATPYELYTNLNAWLLLEYPDTADHHDVIKALILDGASLSFVQLYMQGLYKLGIAGQEDQINIAALFSESEIKDLVQELVASPHLAISPFNLDIYNLQLLFSPNELYEYVLSPLAVRYPEFLVSAARELKYTPVAEQLTGLMRDALQSPLLLDHFDIAVDYLGYDWAYGQARLLVSSSMPVTGNGWVKVCKYLSTEDRASYITTCTDANPFLVIKSWESIAEYVSDIDITKQSVYSEARQKYADVIPNTIKKRLASTDINGVDERTINEMANLTYVLQTITTEGYSERLRMLNLETTSSSTELSNVYLIGSVALIKQKYPETVSKYEEKLDDSPQAGLLYMLNNVIQAVSDESVIANVPESVFTDDPEFVQALVAYTLNYREEPTYVGVMREVLKSCLNGDLYQYRLPASADSFEQFKDSELLPRNMTMQSYDVWRAGLSTNVTEQLVGTTTELLDDLRQTLEREVRHFASLGLESYRDDIEGLDSLITQVGVTISQVSSELKEARSQNDRSRIQEIELMRLSLVSDVKRLRAKRSLIKLYNLTSEEIVSGYYYHDGKPVSTISSLINQAAESEFVGPEGQDALRLISAKMSDSLSRTQEVANLSISISAGANEALLVGTRPLPTCQHYFTGSLNDALLAYIIDPNTQILTVRETEGGRYLARAVVRLLDQGNGDPAMHLEQIYSVSSSVAVRSQIVAAAASMAYSMGIQLYTNAIELGSTIDTNSLAASRLKIADSNVLLRSKNSLAPLVYVDSADGIAVGGRYKIARANQVLPL